jgi:hypothetical protein
MKKFLIISLLTALFSVAAQAQNNDAQVIKIHDAMAPFIVIRIANNAASKVLMTRLDEYNAAVAAHNNALAAHAVEHNAYEVTNAALTQEQKDLAEVSTRHNANRCMKTNGSGCEAYDQETRDYNGKIKDFERRSDANATNYDRLEVATNTLNAREAALDEQKRLWDADAKAYDVINTPNEDAIKPLYQQLTALWDSRKACVESFQTKPVDVSKLCGRRFNAIGNFVAVEK